MALGLRSEFMVTSSLQNLDEKSGEDVRSELRGWYELVLGISAITSAIFDLSSLISLSRSIILSTRNRVKQG